MSFLKKLSEFLFGKTIKTQHPFFGELVDVGDYYECRRMFKPTGKVVEIGLEKQVIESPEQQIQFFNRLESNYDLFIEQVRPAVLDQVRKYLPDYQVNVFKTTFQLHYIYIPSCRQPELEEWQINFNEEEELYHTCVVEMKGTRIQHVYIDG